jgi:uncharacterized protein
MQVSIPNTIRRGLTSTQIGERFVIDVFAPPSNQPLPVVLLTDGNMMFPMVATSAPLLWSARDAHKFILVGIGYDNHSEAMSLRTRDLTPSIDDVYLDRIAALGRPLKQGIIPGGADAFLDFLQRDVRQTIENNYATNGDYTLAGHSLGGLFTLHTMFSKPDHFDRYLAGSPSLWWNGGEMIVRERSFARNNQDLQTALFTSVGAEEQNSSQNDWAQMVSNWRRFRTDLATRNYSSLNLSTRFFDNETHTSVVPATWSAGLRSLLPV